MIAETSTVTIAEVPRCFKATLRPADVCKMRWLIAEDALRNRKGHWFEAMETFYRGFRQLGDDVVVLADAEVDADIRDALAAVPILPPSIWHRAGDGSGRFVRYARVIVHPLQTWWALRRYLRRHSNYDAIFVPTAGLYHVLAWVWLIKGLLRNRSTRVLLFFIHLPVKCDSQTGETTPDGSPTSWLLFRLLHRLKPEIESGKVVLGAETETTRNAVERFSGVPATLFPQIILPLSGGQSHLPESPGEIVMGCYGPPRAEKGSDVLQEAIAIFCRQFPKSPLRFVIHWPEDFTNQDGRTITKSEELMRDPRVEYISRYLDHAEYEERILQTRVMLLPYRLDPYRVRGSRIVLESIVNGIPAIATRGTSPGLALASFGSGLLSEDGDAESLALAIREMELRYDDLARRAREKAPAAVREFSVNSFRRAFLDTGSH